MKNQTFYRGAETKNVKLTKAEKVYNAVQAMKRKAAALESKKAANA